MRWLLPTLGILLILVALRDLFDTLFHPAKRGNITEYITLAFSRRNR